MQETRNPERRPLRILLVTSDKFPPFRPAAKAIFGEELNRRGHTIDWIIQAERPGTPGGTVKFGNGEVLLAASHGGTRRWDRLKKHLADLFNDFRVFGVSRRRRYDIVQVKDKYIAGILALVAARVSGSRFCFWLAYPHAEADLHVVSHGMARYPLLYWLRGHATAFTLYRILLPRADHTFVQSEQMKLNIAARGINPDTMTPIPGSLTLETIPFKGEADPGPEGPVVLYVGTLHRKRRLDFVVRVFKKVLEQMPEARLWFVGGGVDPEDEKMLHTEIEKERIDPEVVTFVGEVPMEDVWQYIEKAAVCLSPIYPSFILDQGSPTKLIEYMAMSRPVVANNQPEQVIVIDQSSAGYCVPWDEGAFAEATLKLLQDPDLARDMGKLGRAWVEQNRTSSAMTDLVERQYRELVGERGGE